MKKFLLFLLFPLFSCSCETNEIFKQCPSLQPCRVDRSGAAILIDKNQDEISTSGCLGHVECVWDEDLEQVELQCLGVHQISDEMCDGIDNDCNGAIDDNPSFDRDNDGFLFCNGDCNDQNISVFPGQQEICNNVDDDCDGDIDGIFSECWTGNPNALFGGISTCKKGEQQCLNGQWELCENQILPQNERCDQFDNDCDGQIDEFEFGCGPVETTGNCTQGFQTCSSSGEEFCEGAIYPQNEECNNQDDDCDGETDEDLERVCETICGIGRDICYAGNWQCLAPVPKEEICNDQDDDCNGIVDDGCPCSLGDIQPCRNGIDPQTGILKNCGLGIQICDVQGMWDTCIFIGEFAEECNNWDDDCDGVVDGMTLICGDFVHAGIGECRTGTITCSMGNWSECVGAVDPKLEICNQKDDDCDTEIDEGLTPRNKTDFMFVLDGSGSMCNKIDQLRQALNIYVQDFVNTEHKFGYAVFPGIYPNEPAILFQNLTDISSFLRSLQSYDCDRNGNEPAYDALEQVLLPSNPLNINWRTDAFPYVVLITDEPANTWLQMTPIDQREFEVAILSNICGIAGCDPAVDKVEMFVMSYSNFYLLWDAIIFFDPSRFVDIAPVNVQRYIDELRKILKNVCI